MLGCQDFCGYYDWTFHYLRHRVGLDAPHRLWAAAISQAQRHYMEAGKAKGLRGLYEAWLGTGEAEGCDWTFTLDEAKNVLRWDMRQCPSKGYLIENDLYADEDYCDHCMGWVKPVLETVGAEVSTHEHNHCGQCFAEIRLKDRPSQTLAGLPCDITHDPRWRHGFVERWEKGVKLPVLPAVSASGDPVEVLRTWFREEQTLTVLGPGPSSADSWTEEHIRGGVIVTGATYAGRDTYRGDPLGVLLDHDATVLPKVAERFRATPEQQRPLLMHAYLAHAPEISFTDYGLPRPVPLLPLLVREGLYAHEPSQLYPTCGVLALLLVAGLDKNLIAAGINLSQAPCDVTGHSGLPAGNVSQWPGSACDRAHVQLVRARLGSRATFHPLTTKRQ